MNNIVKYLGTKLFLVILFMIVFIVAFPKDRVYYTALEIANKNDIQIISRTKDITLFDINLNNVNIYLSSANIAKAANIDIGLFSSEINNIWFLGTFKNMVPKIKSIKIFYKIGNFLVIEGEFGKIIGSLNLLDKKIVFSADITEAVFKKYQNILTGFKKTNKGYIYEYNF